MSKAQSNQFIIGFIGCVGSGKSHVARILAQRLRALPIRTDALRTWLYRHGKPITQAISLSDTLRDRALQRGRSVILDFDAVNPKKQREIRALAKRFGARAFFIHVRAPQELVLERLRRQHYPIPGVFSSFPQARRVYYHRRKLHGKPLRLRPIFVIDNSHPLDPQINRIVNAITK